MMLTNSSSMAFDIMRHRVLPEIQVEHYIMTMPALFVYQ
jgi:hypothetical protein